MLGSIKRLVPQPARQAGRVAFHYARRNRRELAALLRAVKLRSCLDVLSGCEGFAGRDGEVFDLYPRDTQVPVRLRKSTSDFDVFRQVYVHHQYGFAIDFTPEFILDVGANIGLASRYFLDRFPSCRIVAVEPDPENFEIASFNLAPFRGRCHLVNAAVWPERGELGISRGIYGDGRHWATQTVPLTNACDLTVQAVTILSILEEFNFPRLDLLKMDIEGAEFDIFSHGNIDFLSETSLCAVECHGPECEQAFTDAASRHGFQFERCGELTLARR